MNSLATSVVSAAVIGGELILGLSDGSIINAGFVQGPQGLKGDQGPMGATGRSGTDGNTILTVAGAPDTTLGKDGDYAINTVVWEIYGPRSGGVWGAGTPLRGNTRAGGETGVPMFGESSGNSSGGDGRTYTTGNLPLSGTGKSSHLRQEGTRISAPSGNIIPGADNLTYQSNVNGWIVDSLFALDAAIPVEAVDTLPAKGDYEGQLIFMSGGLYLWSEDTWKPVGVSESNVTAFTELARKVERVDDNVDLNQNSVAVGRYIRVEKPTTPTGPATGSVCFLQDGGAEATTFEEVENIQINKTGEGPYADFSDARAGDVLLIQSNIDNGFGQYVIRNKVEQPTFWDFGLEISRNRQNGECPEIGESVTVKSARPVFTVAQDTAPGFSESGQLWYDTSQNELKVWDEEKHEFFNVGGELDGVSVHVGELPPDSAAVGDLWYCTKPDDLTLYVLAELPDVWAAAAPPVSLDGVREDMQNIDNTLSEVRANLFAVDNDVKAASLRIDALEELEQDGGDYLLKSGDVMSGVLNMDNNYIAKVKDPDSGTDATNRRYVENNFVSLYSNNTVEPDGGEWRIQGANKTFIKVDTNNGTCGVFNLQTPSADHHAISRGYVKENAVLKSGNNTVANGWKIQSSDKSHFHVENNQTKIYWLQDPSHAQHPVTMGWADNKYALKSDIPAPDTTSYLPVSGGTLTGNLQFSGGARIDCNNGNTVLSNRGCFELRATSDKPIIFSSGSGANRLLSFYGFDSGAIDKRSEKAYITAGGEARFKGVYSNGKELATKEYVDANAGGSSEGAIAKSGTNTNPTLAKGELYLCTTDNTLRVGI